MLKTDILIVGGGPAGATVARYLAEAERETLLIQRNFGFKKPCGGGIRLDAFDAFDIDRSLIRKHVDSIMLVYRSRRVEVDISETPVAIVDRLEFDTALRARAAKEGSEIREALLVNVEVFDNHVVSTIRQDGKEQRIRSNYLVAADGVNSRIRKIINGDRVNTLLAHYADIDSQAYEVCEFHFGSAVAGRYYAWAFPHSDGANIGTLAGDEKGSMVRFIRQLGIEDAGKTGGYRIPSYENGLFYKDRVFFVGDSASQVLPFTYEGIYYAMDSARILAGVLIEGADPEVYAERWRRQYLGKFKTLKKLQAIFLRNDFMIAIMMRLYANPQIQREMVNLWLGKRDVQINAAFFLRVARRILKRDQATQQ
jgi:geranylgeranyl reductase